MSSINYVFFGTGEIAQAVLEELLSADLVPRLVVTAPSRKQGRGLVLAPSPVATLAATRQIKTIKPEKFDDDFYYVLRSTFYELFVVADYGAILPQQLLDIPQKGTLNMHPSLLPRLRGPSPIRSAILTDEKRVGVSIMLLDDKMDHGPIIAQKEIPIPGWTDGRALRSLGEVGPPHGAQLDEILSHEGGKLLVQILPLWARGEIEAHPQNHDLATYCQKFSKEDGQLDLNADGYQNLLKIRAFEGWPGAFAYFERPSTSSGQVAKKIRTQILDADLSGGKLVIKTVKPEGKTEISYEEFLRSGVRPIR
ncbi:methionyl-tRNA formyltransferase [Candidatus Parcubacteria bacterium]|nr:MAG: methionyl-tRNA formyltransferase [Candidatus Parcubacteria bacterium]